MREDETLDSGMESLMYQLSHPTTGPEIAFETIGMIEKEKNDAYAQLYRYAEDMQLLLSDRKSIEGVTADKDAAYEQLGRFGIDFQQLLKEREAAYDALAKSHLETLQRLAVAAEYKDDDTGVHIIRMSHFSSIIASALGKDEKYCELLLQASPMHDIGKIGVPDSVLKKTGKLTEEEWVQMRRHPEYGASILSGSDVSVIRLASEIALSHHEKYDGSGYPSGLSGKDIPLSGRIVSLADYFDALTMDRVYRKAFPDEKVFEMIRENSGIHFDPEVVDAFFRVVDEIIAERERINNKA